MEITSTMSDTFVHAMFVLELELLKITLSDVDQNTVMAVICNHQKDLLEFRYNNGSLDYEATEHVAKLIDAKLEDIVC